MTWFECRCGGNWELKPTARSKYSAASVWTNGTWHTYDRKGTGGENWTEEFTREALWAAEAAVRRAGHWPMPYGPIQLVEWRRR